MMDYNKLPIGKGQQIHLVTEREYEFITDKNIALLSVLHDKPESYFESMPLGDLEKEIKKTGWMAEEPKKPRPFFHFPYLYQFVSHPAQMLAGDFKVMQKLNHTGDVKHLHETTAILTVKRWFWGSKVRIRDQAKEHAKRSRLFQRKMSFGTAYGYSSFFLRCYPTILELGLLCSQSRHKAAMEVLEKLKTHSSIGSDSPTSLQVETS